MRVSTGLRELGYEIETTGKWFELAGSSKTLRKKFSKRSEVVEEKAKALGITSPKDRDGLAALTREKKCKDMSIADLEPFWKARLTAQDIAELDGLGRGRAASLRQSRSASESLGGGVRWRHVMESSNPREAKEPATATQADFKAVDLAIKHLLHTVCICKCGSGMPSTGRAVKWTYSAEIKFPVTLSPSRWPIRTLVSITCSISSIVARAADTMTPRIFSRSSLRHI